jgi:acyl carrier protein
MTTTIPNLAEVTLVLTQIIADKMEIDASSINADSNLQALGLDSLDTFDLIFSAEDRFKIKVPNDQINIVTVQDVGALVHRLIVEQNPHG